MLMADSSKHACIGGSKPVGGVYVSTSLQVVEMVGANGTHAAAKMPAAFWLRQANGSRTLMYRLTPSVLAWILAKLRKMDDAWVAADYGRQLSDETRGAMRALADRAVGVLAIAVELGISAGSADRPELPLPPVSLSELELMDRRKARMEEVIAAAEDRDRKHTKQMVGKQVVKVAGGLAKMLPSPACHHDTPSRDPA